MFSTEFSSMEPLRLRVLHGMFSTEFSSIDPARLRGAHAKLARLAFGAARRSSKDTGEGCDGIPKLKSLLPRRGMQKRPLIGGLDMGVPTALRPRGVS